MKALIIYILLTVSIFLYADEDISTPLTAIPTDTPLALTSKKADIDLYIKQAIVEYQNNNFLQALDYFLLVENAGIKHPDLFFNIGNGYYRTGNIPFAIVYYKRALLLDSTHKLARNNLNFVIDEPEETTDNLTTQFFVGLYQKFSINTLLVWCLIIFALIIAIIHIQWHFVQFDRTVLRFINFFLLFILLIFVGLLISRALHLRIDEAVIVENTVYVYSGPSESFTRLLTIQSGTVIVVENEQADWTHISVPGEGTGWIPGYSYKKVRE